MNWINNIKKSFVLLALAAFVAIPSVVTMAQTLTDTIARDVTPWYGEDQSTYATVNNRFGVIVRHYRYDVHGGAIGTINLGAALPNGALIIGGVVDIDTFLTGTGDNSLGVVTATDISACRLGMSLPVDVTATAILASRLWITFMAGVGVVTANVILAARL